MYDKAFHQGDLSTNTFLVTGGAGFIGSNLVEYLMKHGAGKVKVLDNLSEGKVENLQPWLGKQNFEFVEGSINDLELCQKLCDGVDYVLHQAALGSVPRSIENPVATHQANATGFVNMLTAAKNAKVQRFVYASSSSVYGDSKQLPKQENQIGNQLSPYAVSKFVDELYAGVFSLNYGMEVIGLRYFNIFGPRQKPDGPYAAVIPLFMDALLNNKKAYINGDGDQTRDFTFVENAVQANIKAIFTEKEEALGEVFNVAVGDRVSINYLYQIIKGLTGAEQEPVYRAPRKGDVRDSLADISKAQNLLGYQPEVKIHEGLKSTLEWFKTAHKQKV